MLEVLKELPSDSVLGLIKLYGADTNPNKVDLGVGVYKNEQGNTPVMSAVKLAESQILESEASKTYFGSDGNPAFLDAIVSMIFGDDPALTRRIVGCQSVGGSGALQIAAKLAVSCGGAPSIWVGTPTWPNHLPLFAASGLDVRTYEYYDQATQKINLVSMFEALSKGRVGDLVLLHACCHNPTGADLDLEDFSEAIDLIVAKGMVPLIDAAYLGLGNGFNQDLRALQLVVSRVPEALIAFSCSKNFGLYRERIGALFVLNRSLASTGPVKSHVQYLARTVYSTPPNHGAAIVSTILSDPAIQDVWLSELNDATARLNTMRALLAGYGRIGQIDLGALAKQKGMFALLPLSPEQVSRLKDDFSIYMAPSGRVNLAGLNKNNIPYFVSSLSSIVA